MTRGLRVSIALFGGIAISGLLAAILSPAAQAECPQWNVSGDWTIFQSNTQSNYSQPTFKFQQEGKTFKGTARLEYVHEDECIFLVQCGDDYYHHTASVDGEVDDESVQFTAYWSNGSIGYYEGTINNQGRMKGTGYERRSPDTIVTWFSDRTAECTGSSSDALSTEEPGTLKAQGRVKTGTPSTGPKLTICEKWRKARDRNSPAATVSGLKAQCLASGELEATEETTE